MFNVTVAVFARNGFENRNEIVDANEVAVFVVADLPCGFVVNGDVVRNGDGLGEVYHPDRRLPLIVDEEKGAADELVGSEEVGLVQGFTDVLQSF